MGLGTEWKPSEENEDVLGTDEVTLRSGKSQNS